MIAYHRVLLRLTAPLLIALHLASCAASVPLQQGAHAALCDRLYLGRSIAGGGSVSDADWELFVAGVVVPAFPDGHTVWRAEGAWRGADGSVVREPSFVLELIRDNGSGDAAIETIINTYKSRFRQESVLWVRAPVWVRF